MELNQYIFSFTSCPLTTLSVIYNSVKIKNRVISIYNTNNNSVGPQYQNGNIKEDSQLCYAIALFDLVDIYELALFWSQMISYHVMLMHACTIIIIITWRNKEGEKKGYTQRD